MKTAAQGAAKYKASTGTAPATWLQGIQGTTVDVMQRAINAAPAAVTGYTQSLTSGAWARAIQQSGGTGNWKSKSEQKQGAYAAGLTNGADKLEVALGKILGDMPGIVASAGARGPTGSEQNYARSASVGRQLHANKGKYKA